MNYCMFILASLSRSFTWRWTVCCLVGKSCPTLLTLGTVALQARILEGVGCHFLLQGIFLTQGLNPSLLQSRRILFTTEPHGKGCLYHLLYAYLGVPELIIYLMDSTVSLFSFCSHYAWSSAEYEVGAVTYILLGCLKKLMSFYIKSCSFLVKV